MFQIGVGNAKPRQNRALGIFHRVGVLIVNMIIACQMQNRMHKKMCRVIGKGLFLRPRLAQAGVVGNGDIAQFLDLGQFRMFARQARAELDGRPAQHIGGLGLAAELGVQFGDALVVAAQHHDLKFVQFQGRYLFSSLTPIAIFFALGLREVGAREHERVLAALTIIAVFVLALFGLWYVIRPGL